MRVGSVVFSTTQGISILAKDFHDEGVVTDVVVLRHGRRPENEDWYPGSPRVGMDNAGIKVIRDLCDSVDVMLFFETPFDWTTIDYCRQRGIKTALMVMYECMPTALPAQPDLVLCPSLLDLSYYPEGKFIPVPVPRSVKWRQRTRAEVFVHNAGHGGLKGRNGTKELLEAWQCVRSPARLVIRSQVPFKHYSDGTDTEKRDPETGKSLLVSVGTFSHGSLFQEGDVFVFPEKFNGLSLPLQEARAAGMLGMATDRFPTNMWLPRESLVPVNETRKNRVSPRCHEFDEAVVDPKAIAAKIDEWYGRDITPYSQEGRAWAETMSWDALRPKYLEILEGLVKS